MRATIKDFCLWNRTYKDEVRKVLDMVDNNIDVTLFFNKSTALNNTIACLIKSIDYANMGFDKKGTQDEYDIRFDGEYDEERERRLRSNERYRQGVCTHECYELKAYVFIRREWREKEEKRLAEEKQTAQMPKLEKTTKGAK